ncbi:MAG: hypothetical protein CMH48_03690 [Muricauda sp.]|nr:HEAT repeat domain-containing protein [Allomuricauda sp.]MBC29926.1 hypothetical protein [Allomuricauda sp.]|tara:strand:+ start:42592 stop:44676 length:2085 start_codon:yes stop_codon:yes gene_type:complete
MFTILGVVYFAFIFFFKRKISFHSKRLSEKKKKLAPVISNFLFHDHHGPIEEQKSYVQLKIEIRGELKNKSFRKILTEILMDLEKDVSGETKKKLHRLYAELGLHLDAFQKLKSWRWEVVSSGILELTEMQRIDAYPFITKFLNDRRGIIRKQAEIATVSLKPEGISHLLDTTRYSISEWQQLKIMEELREMENFRPPQFATWLISPNRDVVLFSLRLMRHYNQNDAAKSIVELIKHKDDQVKTEAIRCIKEFCILRAIDPLKKVFWSCNEMVKIEILEAISTLGSKNDIEFLLKVEKQEPSFMVRTKALTAINDLAPDTIIPTKDIMSRFKKDKKDSIDIELANAKTVSDSAPVTVHDKETPPEDDLVAGNETYFESIDVYEVDPKTISLADDAIHAEDHLEASAGEQEAEMEKEYEFGPLEEEMDEVFNGHLGLVNPDSNQEQTDDSNALQPKFSEEYQKLSPPEQEKLIESLEISGSDRDIPVLEDLMKQQNNPESGFRIFKMLKKLKTRSDIANTPSSEPSYNVDELLVEAKDSIFYPLFEYADGTAPKLALLEEIADVGDERELALLEKLTHDQDVRVAQRAGRAKEQLLQKLTSDEEAVSEMATQEPAEQPEMVQDNHTEKAPLEQNPKTGETNEADDELLPLELCFLYDELGIKGANDHEEGLNFELSEEFYLYGNSSQVERNMSKK